MPTCKTLLIKKILIFVVIYEYILTDMKEGILSPEEFPVIAFMRRRDFLDPGTYGDNVLKQVGKDWPMNAYLCVLGSDEMNDAGVSKIAMQVADKWNEYAKSKRNSGIKEITYHGEITKAEKETDLKSLDHYIPTKDIVTFARK